MPFGIGAACIFSSSRERNSAVHEVVGAATFSGPRQPTPRVSIAPHVRCRNFPTRLVWLGKLPIQPRAPRGARVANAPWSVSVGGFLFAEPDALPNATGRPGYVA